MDRICEKYNIAYSLGYGSLLGAVRHKGYIPWDDDIDVLMLREDYDRFKDVCKEELPSKMFFQDYETDKEYLWGYAKLRNINTEYVRKNQSHIKCKSGVFIDIFPLDDIEESLVKQIIQDCICTVYRKILWSKVGCVSEKNLLKRMVYKILNVIPKEIVYKSVKKYIKK